jgi:hypothetical protein
LLHQEMMQFHKLKIELSSTRVEFGVRLRA